MRHRLTPFEQRIYAEVAGQIQGALANKGRSKSQYVAHMAHERAMDQVREWRISKR